MEYGALVHNSAFGNLSDSATVTEGEFIDELLVEGCWLETSAGGSYNFMQQPCGSVVVTEASQQHYLGASEQSNQQQQQQMFQQESEESFVVGKRWWIGPSANPEPSSSVKERLVVAVGYLKEYTKNANVLIQIWVPLRRGLDQYHRNVSNPDEGVSVGFPMSPNANPNPNVYVRFFRSNVYPRVHDGRGSLALPVFERGSGTCLGVFEFVMTNQSIINYRPQLENVCNALEAVDFRSCQNFIPPAVKVFDELYQAALNEIVEVLTSVCKTHNLPLALTWAPCIQQGKCGCGHSTENYVCCVSTVDSACFVGDLDILGFQEACSEYHLFRGQGIVGTAFTTTKPCFAIDITAFSKAEYPLSHHAKMFGLHAAVAIPLRSVYTGSADFVLEFFLPKDCHDTEEQKHMLNSLSMLVQQACRSLHVVMEDEFTLPQAPPPPPHNNKEEINTHRASQSQVEPCSKESSWIAHMMEAQEQQKGKGVSVSLEYLEEPKEEFKVTTNWDSTDQDQDQEHVQAQVFSDFGQFEQSSVSRYRTSVEGGEESYTFGGRRSSSGGRKSGEKRRTKAEKTISLPVLRQYFAGSLKDAAKSIGVCPTTLKRICRQHGITRWPSRKIKKVGHSLKKLQLVIDSVQGAEGAIQIGSFYTSFPELSSADASTFRHTDSSKKMHTYTDNVLYGHGDGVTSLKSPPSSCSQNFGPTINQPSTLINTVSVSNNGDVLMTESTVPDALLRRTHSEAELHVSIQEDTKHFTIPKSQTLPPLSESSGWNSRERGAFRVKATFADEKIRFSLQPIWGFRDLQLEIARRFNLNDVSNIVLKYLDDEGEWVVLACDADLEECKDLHRSSQSRTIRLSLFQASPLNLANTFGNNSPS
ncbi:protein NLP2-like [Gastrolobium bilobum]|uniref:protein NLP2-like n=1 Tax=Gastrolobium bilobum TaxID=150636 RepID=UPI002AB05CF5|nr:protein NLP2-like [Gastrolobium bilobum]